VSRPERREAAPAFDVARAFQRAATLHQSGALADAERAYRDVLRAAPDLPQALNNLGHVLTTTGRADEALPLLHRALATHPQPANVHNHLGLALAATGSPAEAIAAYRVALSLAPEHAGAWNNLALTLASERRVDEALACYDRALRLAPDALATRKNLGVLLAEAGRLAEAERCFARVLAACPDDAGARVNLGNLLARKGRAAEALRELERAVLLEPDEPRWRSALLMTLHYGRPRSREDVLRAHLAWGERHGRPRAALWRSRAPSPRGAKIRVGYVSPDLRAHAVAFFLEPLLATHDRGAFELFAYAEVASPDAVTARLRPYFQDYRCTVGMSDEAIARRIVADRVDVLVDLAGHTAGQRLGVFRYVPAPVQATYLGYPDTTGAPSVGYRITDATADPEGAEAFATERLVRLAPGFLCYGAPKASPSPACPPADAPFTFGSFSNTAKIGPEAVRAWAAILRAAPASRLLLKFWTFNDAETAAGYRARFEEQGIARERVVLLAGHASHEAHLARHADVDLVLDPFPYNGTTTTCEALWMGVPVLTLRGDGHVARVGASLLSRVGLDALVATDEPDYVARAIRLAQGGLPRSLEARLALRERFRASSLGDPVPVTRALEDAYRVMLAEALAGSAAS
jgi:predicted O-linked N-acetylglucosamine transferase (SPINDLY family)